MDSEAMTAISSRCEAFRELHRSGCFVVPNPWDRGSARLLAGLGFQALATTSSGFAASRGRADHHVSLEETLDALRSIAEAVEIPVNADFEGGFAIEPADVGANVRLAAATGIAGLSIEDSTGDPTKPLFDLDLAIERIAAARRAIDESGTGILLTGRSEGVHSWAPGSLGNHSTAHRLRRSRSRLPFRAGHSLESGDRSHRQGGLAQASECAGRQ